MGWKVRPLAISNSFLDGVRAFAAFLEPPMTVSNLIRSSLAILAFASPALVCSAPKKLLVITVTTGFRHSSIETAEKVLKELGAKSGAWTVDYVHQPEG